MLEEYREVGANGVNEVIAGEGREWGSGWLS